MDQYIDQEQTLASFCKNHHFHPDLLYQLQKEFAFIRHPSLAMLNLMEIIRHKKNLACIESPKLSGRTTSCLIILLNCFLKTLAKLPADQNGIYFFVISASREKSTAAKLLVDKMVQNNSLELTTLDLNSQFPIASQKQPAPQLQLPPQSQSVILFGTYYTIQKLKHSNKFDPEQIRYALFDDCSLVQIYGGQDQLSEISKWLTFYQFVVYVGEERIVEEVIGKAITIAKIEEVEEDDDEQAASDGGADNGDVNTSKSNFYYYLSRDAVQQAIVTYITLKLNLVQGKTLILVNNMQELYFMKLLLSRCNIPRHQIYNHENPKTLKYYILATFNTGVINLLVATPQLLLDLRNEFFERKKKGSQSASSYSLKKLDNLILYNMLPFKLDEKVAAQVNSMICIVQNEERHVEHLMGWMDEQKEAHKCREFPIKENEVEAFRYRIQDVTMNISKHQVKQAEQLDFKQKMLKSPDLSEYFSQNQKEKELLQQQIIKLKKTLGQGVKLPDGPVPEYLLPSIIKNQKKAEGESSRKRLLIQVAGKEKDAAIKKRRLLNAEQNNNMLPESDDGETDKKKDVKERYVTINEEEEDPEMLDPSRLRPISGRKLWKIAHGFKLKKRNKRLEKKGIFNA